MENYNTMGIISEFSENGLPEAAMLELNKMNKRINDMSEKKLINMLNHFHLSTEGSDTILRNRLKDSYQKIIEVSKDLCLSNELLPYYVVVDFEATCEEINPPKFKHEIIEFPAVLVNSKEQKIVDYFQMYCKPQIYPNISKFCTELTGITQEQVDSAETFDKVYNHFTNWLAKHNLGKKFKFAIVTDGPWDMSRFFYSQCHYSNIKVPKWAKSWVNLKKAFGKFYQCERICLKNMLDFMGLKFIGRPHCGLDDAQNIARILLKMIYDGANVQINERITSSKRHIEQIKRSNEKENSNVDKESKIKVEALYTPIYYLDKMPVYKKTKRDRLVGEVKIAKKIFQDSNNCEKVSPKKINKKVLRES